jgi:hypothetical protein
MTQRSTWLGLAWTGVVIAVVGASSSVFSAIRGQDVSGLNVWVIFVVLGVFVALVGVLAAILGFRRASGGVN